ncbi:MAG: chloride channel protein [Desulfobacterales bacterium]|nr:MAG: chloride channel protein [Desulfobacterales bacterium]
MRAIRNRYIAPLQDIFQNNLRIHGGILLILAGAVTGICSGLAALCLKFSLEHTFEWLHPYRQYWWALLLPGAGAMLSSLFLNKMLKEAPGHGVPEVIYAVSRYGGLLRFRSSFSRLISSLLTIGSGGSAGPEAPVVMSGSAIGSNIAKLFSLNERQRITLVGCGTAGAIAGIFNAPITGMIFAAEIILGEWKLVNIIPIAVAAVTGAETAHLFVHDPVLFSHVPFEVGVSDTLACLGLAVLAALISALFIKTMARSGNIAHNVSMPVWIKAFMGGCAVGLMAFAFPIVLGEGYGYIQSMISGTFSAGMMLTAAALLLKILATAATLGWGGSGGIFAPCLLLGSLTGCLFYQLLTACFPEIGFAPPGAYALLGMTGLISGVMQAPLTGIFLIVEITGGHEAILQLITVSAMSSTLSHYMEPASFYFKDLIHKGQFLRPGTDARVLIDLNLNELLDTAFESVTQNMMFREFIELAKVTRQEYFPVLDDTTGRFLGLIKMADIRPYSLDPAMYDMVFLNQIMDTDVPTAPASSDLRELIEIMDHNGVDAISIVDHGRFAGMVSKARILDLYRKELMVQTSHH